MVEAVQETVFRAFDGTRFLSREEAARYEDEHFEKALVGLTLEQVRAAVARQPTALRVSNALEKAGTLIARARVASGDLRRKPKGGQPAAPSETQQQGQAQDEAMTEAA